MDGTKDSGVGRKWLMAVAQFVWKSKSFVIPFHVNEYLGSHLTILRYQGDSCEVCFESRQWVSYWVHGYQHVGGAAQ